MATKTPSKPNLHMADKEALRKILDGQDRLTGAVPDPTATAKKAREMMIAGGVRPEDNIGSRDITRRRYGLKE